MNGVFADATGTRNGSNGPHGAPGGLIFRQVTDNAIAAGIAECGFSAGFRVAGEQGLQSLLQEPLSPDSGGAT
ncbi:MAG: hypothetical protein ACOVRM_01185 [Planctomycetaceae bacterium]